MVRAAQANSDLGLSSKEAEEIQSKSRLLRRVANPFVDFYVIMAVGAAGSPATTEAARRREDRQTRDHARDFTPTQRKIYTEDFEEITNTLPFLKDRLVSDESSQTIKKITHLVQTLADQAKQTDTKGAKHNIVSLIPKRYLPPDENGNPAVNAYRHINVQDPNKTKSWRGWGNRITSRLLCPIDYVAQFEADPDETRAKLAQGELPLNDNVGDPKFPAFLYDEDIMDDSLTTGLLRGPLLLAVYTFIFISPSAAAGASTSSRKGNAERHGIVKVIPSTICYVAVHTYVALCCLGQWGEKWKGVKLPRLYILLREQFAHQDDPWCVETLKWWNEKIFSSSTELDEDSAEGSRDMQGPSTQQRLANERQRRVQTMAGN